jgi:hypothetical protein
MSCLTDSRDLDNVAGKILIAISLPVIKQLRKIDGDEPMSWSLILAV